MVSPCSHVNSTKYIKLGPIDKVPSRYASSLDISHTRVIDNSQNSRIFQTRIRYMYNIRDWTLAPSSSISWIISTVRLASIQSFTPDSPDFSVVKKTRKRLFSDKNLTKPIRPQSFVVFSMAIESLEFHAHRMQIMLCFPRFFINNKIYHFQQSKWIYFLFNFYFSLMRIV